MMITMSINKAIRQMSDNNVVDLKVTLAAMEDALDEFEAAHKSYVLTLEDGDIIDQAEAYYNDVFNKYYENKRTIKQFIMHPVEHPVHHSDEKIQEEIHPSAAEKMMSSLVQALNLPRIEIMKFNGDPRHFTTFITVFKETVEAVTTDGQRRLTQLLHHTTGPAHDAVESCIGTGGDAAYQKAMDKLKSRFGSPHVICETILSDLSARKEAKTAPELRHLADNLSNAAMILKEHGKYPEINTQNFIIGICKKLDTRLRYKWRERATNAQMDNGAYPTFSDFVSFVERRADISNDPVYGGDVLADPSHRIQGSSTPANNGSSSFVVDTRRSSCLLCKDDHKLYMCKQFRSRSLSERVKYVTDNNLCCVCLSHDHITDACNVNYRCPISNCNGRHSKYIHVTNSLSPFSSASNCTVSKLPMNVSHNNCVLMPVLHVTVNDTFHTYALLDTGSSTSFCSRRLVTQLNINGPISTYELNTIGKTVYEKSEMVQFAMSTSNISVNMNNVRVVNSIPVHSCTCDLSKYSHLDDLIHPGNVTVDILIGQDHPLLLRPLEVKSGADDDPFAVRTVLGWTINGPVTHQPSSRHVITSDLISTVDVEDKLDRSLVVAIPDDVPSSSTESVQISEMCNRYLRTIDDDHIELPVPCNTPGVVLYDDNPHLGESQNYMMYAHDTEIKTISSTVCADGVPAKGSTTAGCLYLPLYSIAEKNFKMSHHYMANHGYISNSLSNPSPQHGGMWQHDPGRGNTASISSLHLKDRPLLHEGPSFLQILPEPPPLLRYA